MADSNASGDARAAVPWPREPALWGLAMLGVLTLAMPGLAPGFAAAFPQLERPMYEHDSFAALLAWHVGLVALSSVAAAAAGIAAGVFVTREAGREFRGAVETVVAIGQTVPPVAVLALAVPLLGFGVAPVLIALFLYGLLPILRGTLSGLESVPAEVREASAGLGLNAWQRLAQAELPLALPGVLAGVRSSVAINIGTATVAATVGVRSLGSPIIVGLAGFNTAYVVQGAVLVALLAVGVDGLFARAAQRVAGRVGA
ncbi:MAG: ABC transporter permease [Rubrivivax sp.]|nr:ABC transporter permease [Rubrivivax sp.]